MEQSYNDNKKWKAILLKFSHSSFTWFLKVNITFHSSVQYVQSHSIKIPDQQKKKKNRKD